MTVVLSVDAGTTGVRTLVLGEDATVLHVAYRPLTQHVPRPGWVEHDAQEIWDLVRQTLGEATARLTGAGHRAVALGITNQRETAIAWDRRTGRPLAPAIVWQDRRTAGRCDELVAAGLTNQVRQITGLVLDPYFSATKFEWLLGQGGIDRPPGLALGTVDAWLVWQLTGGAHGGLLATDPSNASRTLLFDIHGGSWSPELCDIFSVPATALPEVRPSCGRYGTVAPNAVPELAGLPISGVAGDQQAALFGQACVAPGMAKVTYGTGSFVLSYVGTEPPPPPDGLVTTVAWDLGPHGRGGLEYALEGSTFVAGAAIQWLRDGLGIIHHTEEVGPLAESVTDAGGVTVVPAFTGLGSPWWDPYARGTIVGITGRTGRAHLARAVVEAMAFSVRDMTDAMAVATGARWRELRADGGASVMGLLLQLQADQVRAPVVRPRSTESTALGAALLAGLAEDVWGSVEQATVLWQPDEQRHPQIDQAAADTAYASWLAAVARARDWDRQAG